MPGWWNWQTRKVEGLVGAYPVRVRIPPPAFYFIYLILLDLLHCLVLSFHLLRDEEPFKGSTNAQRGKVISSQYKESFASSGQMIIKLATKAQRKRG